MKIVIIAVSAVVLIFGVIQLIPVERSNPEVVADFDGPAEVEAALRRACYDCHSHETVWPWYAKVAPMSWIVAHDVEEARGHLNFSQWGSYPPSRQRHAAHEAIEEITEGKMPLPGYVALHDEAVLSDAEVDLLRRWSQQLADAAPADAAPEENEKAEDGE